MTAAPTPRVDLRFNVLSLLRRPGVRHPVVGGASVAELQVGDSVVAAGTLAMLDLVVEATADSITVTGTISAPFRAECRRCLEPMTAVAVADVQEIFERHPVDGETYLLDVDQIDLEPLIRESVLLALPLAPLCREDCPGPAPDLFPTVVASDDGPPHAEEHEAEPPLDPRWGPLRDLKLD